MERASSYPDALARLRQGEFDLVVCALTVPADSGLDFLREARAEGVSTAFVLLSRDVTPELRERARVLGNARCMIAQPLRDARVRGPEPEPLLTGASLAPAPSDPSADAGRPRPGQSGVLAPAMLWRTDADGAFTHFTRDWLRFRGRDEARERGGGWEEGLHPEDTARWRDALRRTLRAASAFEIDVRLAGADGLYRWVRMAGRPVLQGGTFAGYVGSSFEITDLKREIITLREQLGRASRTQRDLEEFAHAVAHELDTPLRTLEYGLERLRTELSGEKELAEAPDGALEQSRQSARRMRALLRDLLNLALSGDAGREECVSLDEPLSWALENLGPALDESGVELERESLPEVSCEPTQIARVFQNLLSNALKFRRPVPLHVSVRAEIAANEVIVHVEDNGRGIDPAHQPAIFDPFQRAHADDIPGSGLGLALCRKIIERHGGRIWVRSRPGEGSRLSFSLPLAAELPAPR